MRYLAGLLLTIGSEFAVLSLRTDRRLTTLLLAAVGINLITWPIANLTYQVLPNRWLIEIGVVIVETSLLAVWLRYRWQPALMLSIVANSVSALLGIFLFG